MQLGMALPASPCTRPARPAGMTVGRLREVLNDQPPWAPVEIDGLPAETPQIGDSRGGFLHLGYAVASKPTTAEELLASLADSPSWAPVEIDQDVPEEDFVDQVLLDRVDHNAGVLTLVGRDE